MQRLSVCLSGWLQVGGVGGGGGARVVKKGAEEVVLENRHMRARLQTKTGRLTSLLLKDNTGARQKGGSRRSRRRRTVTLVLCHVCRRW